MAVNPFTLAPTPQMSPEEQVAQMMQPQRTPYDQIQDVPIEQLQDPFADIGQQPQPESYMPSMQDLGTGAMSAGNSALFGLPEILLRAIAPGYAEQFAQRQAESPTAATIGGLGALAIPGSAATAALRNPTARNGMMATGIGGLGLAAMTDPAMGQQKPPKAKPTPGTSTPAQVAGEAKVEAAVPLTGDPIKDGFAKQRAVLEATQKRMQEVMAREDGKIGDRWRSANEAFEKAGKELVALTKAERGYRTPEQQSQDTKDRWGGLGLAAAAGLGTGALASIANNRLRVGPARKNLDNLGQEAAKLAYKPTLAPEEMAQLKGVAERSKALGEKFDSGKINKMAGDTILPAGLAAEGAATTAMGYNSDDPDTQRFLMGIGMPSLAGATGYKLARMGGKSWAKPPDEIARAAAVAGEARVAASEAPRPGIGKSLYETVRGPLEQRARGATETARIRADGDIARAYNEAEAGANQMFPLVGSDGKGATLPTGAAGASPQLLQQHRQQIASSFQVARESPKSQAMLEQMAERPFQRVKDTQAYNAAMAQDLGRQMKPYHLVKLVNERRIAKAIEDVRGIKAQGGDVGAFVEARTRQLKLNATDYGTIWSAVQKALAKEERAAKKLTRQAQRQLPAP